MAKGKGKSKSRRKPPVRPEPAAPAESQTSEAATVAWTVAVTMVAVCDLAAIGAHAYVLRNPESGGAALLGQLMLVAGGMIGVGVLVGVPFIYRLRRVPPPTGFTVFAACAAAAPLLALIARAVQ